MTNAVMSFVMLAMGSGSPVPLDVQIPLADSPR